MSKENTNDKTEKAYQSMLNSVEELVAKEGKNIKEAINIAEQKLSEWGELGREEVTTVREEVERDLGSIGETMEEAKKSFRQKWEMDAKYLSDATWNTLSSIADNTALALMDFREELQEKMQEATKDLHQREHKDHREWHSDHAMWSDDLTIWQKEQSQSEQYLAEAQEAINNHSAQLKEHARTIQTHKYIDSVHEKNISRAEQNPDNHNLKDIDDTNEASYEAMKESHEEEAAKHLQIKQNHREITLQMEKLHRMMQHLK